MGGGKGPQSRCRKRYNIGSVLQFKDRKGTILPQGKSGAQTDPEILNGLKRKVPEKVNP